MQVSVQKDYSPSESLLRVEGAPPNTRYEILIYAGGTVFCYNVGSNGQGEIRLSFPRVEESLTIQGLQVLPGMEGPPGQEKERRGPVEELGSVP